MTINVRPVNFTQFEEDPKTNTPHSSNIKIVTSIALDVVIKLGEAQIPIESILEWKKGTIIELDKQLGDPIDIIVGSKTLARGEVIVIDDKLVVRISEVVKKGIK
jgi:flagellar motor switch protein FliN/FliY